MSTGSSEAGAWRLPSCSRVTLWLTVTLCRRAERLRRRANAPTDGAHPPCAGRRLSEHPIGSFGVPRDRLSYPSTTSPTTAAAATARATPDTTRPTSPTDLLRFSLLRINHNGNRLNFVIVPHKPPSPLRITRLRTFLRVCSVLEITFGGCFIFV